MDILNKQESLNELEKSKKRLRWTPKIGQLVYNNLLKESGHIISKNFVDYKNIYFFVKYTRKYTTGGVWKTDSLPLVF